MKSSQFMQRIIFTKMSVIMVFIRMNRHGNRICTQLYAVIETWQTEVPPEDTSKGVQTPQEGATQHHTQATYKPDTCNPGIRSRRATISRQPWQLSKTLSPTHFKTIQKLISSIYLLKVSNTYKKKGCVLVQHLLFLVANYTVIFFLNPFLHFLKFYSRHMYYFTKVVHKVCFSANYILSLF